MLRYSVLGLFWSRALQSDRINVSCSFSPFCPRPVWCCTVLIYFSSRVLVGVEVLFRSKTMYCISEYAHEDYGIRCPFAYARHDTSVLRLTDSMRIHIRVWEWILLHWSNAWHVAKCLFHYGTIGLRHAHSIRDLSHDVSRLICGTMKQ